MQAIGYKELLDFLEGEISFDGAVDKIKQESRRYAKRQLTWFRRDKNTNWIYKDTCSAEEAKNKAFMLCDEYLGEVSR